jgi:hypothetical protein
MAVIQGALLATFYAFSANTRSLILQGHGDLTPERLLAKRIVALPVLAIASWVLCVIAAGVSPALAALLILRRACEWLAEVRLCEVEVAAERRAARRAFVVQAGVTLGVAGVLAFAPASALPALAVFAISAALRRAAAPVVRRVPFRDAGKHAARGDAAHRLDRDRRHLDLRATPGRLPDRGREVSGLLFTAFLLGSFVATLFANVLGPSLALQRARERAGRLPFTAA